MEKFHPEFHWQIEKKTENKKKLLKIFLVLLFCFIFAFLAYKTFFIPEKNISLTSLIPDSSRAILSVNKIDNILRRFGQDKIVSYIKPYTGNDDFRSRNVFSKLNKEIVWVEDSNNSQVLIIKTGSSTFLESDIFANKKDGELEIENKKISYINFAFPENSIFSKKDKIYFVKLNEYIFCVSNDADFLTQVVVKYNDLLKNKFKTAENINYLNGATSLKFEIRNYDLNSSGSFAKGLSFLNNVLVDQNGKLEINFLQNSADVFVFKNEDFEKSKIVESLNYYYFPDLFNDSFYYKNFLPENNDLDKKLLSFVSQSINSNIDISNEIFRSKEVGMIAYKNGNFLLESADFDSMSNVFRKLLSVSNPDIRKINLPDGSMAEEYYANFENVSLKEYDDGNFVWYYDENIKNQKFEMVKCNNLFFVSSDKQKILNFCTNRDRANMLFNKKQENINQVTFMDLKNNSQIPFFGKVKKLVGINFGSGDNEILFFRMFY